MRSHSPNYLALFAGSLALGSFTFATQCGGGSSGGNPSTGGDGGDQQQGGPDATTDSGESGGGDSGHDAGPSLPDSGLDATVTDAGTNSDAAPDTGVDAGLDAGPEASSLVPCDMDAEADAADAEVCSGPSTMACCSGFCVDTALDPRNCGQCGVACTAHQFCTGVQCDDAVVANVCGNPSATVVLDIYGADDEGGTAIGVALAAICTPPTNVVYRNEDAGGVTDPTTGRPITGVGNTFVTGGGGYGHVGIAYLDMMNLTPLFPSVTGDEYDVVERSTGTNVVSTTFEALTSQHDYFYIELAVEPISGTLSVSGVGLLAPGTVAAGYYLGAVVIPNRASYPNNWYLFEWTDTNGDSIANAGDTFTQVATGNP
jgi:hypothetical protein